MKCLVLQLIVMKRLVFLTSGQILADFFPEFQLVLEHKMSFVDQTMELLTKGGFRKLKHSAFYLFVVGF
jgi:hypothetical protein